MGIVQIAPDLWRLRANIVANYLLRDEEGVVLIDTGWVGGRGLLERALTQIGAGWAEVNLILLTHGHIDHVGNAAWIQGLAPRARLLVHAADAAHTRGRHVYRGWSRGCALLEALARPLTRFRAPEIHGHFVDGEVVPRAGGLRIVHLPGHTAGHCGIVHAPSGLLFCGDLFSTTLGVFHWPPPFLNSAAEHFPATHAKAAALEVRGFLPAHCDNAAPERQRERFLRKCGQR